MRTGIRLAVAALIIVAGFVGFRMAAGNPILLEDVQAVSHGGALVGVTLTIRNAGPPDRLLSVDVPGSQMALLKSENTNPVPVPASRTVSLAADGAHIMIGGLADPPQEGRLIPLVLHFENAGPVKTKARFSAPMAMAKAGGAAGMTMNHGAMGSTEYDVPEGEPAPSLSLAAEPTAEGGFTVRIAAADFTFSKEKADGPHEAATGHGHFYVGGAKIGRVYGESAEINGLPAGEHIARVTLNTNDHRTYVVGGQPVTATVILSVE